MYFDVVVVAKTGLFFSRKRRKEAKEEHIAHLHFNDIYIMIMIK